jgi:acyl dehydratase
VEELQRLPENGPLFRRAVTGLVPGAVTGLVPGLLPGRRGGDTLDDTELLVRGVAVDAERLAAYARVCGFRLSDALPPTYPHIMAFPLALELMTRPRFPFPLVGLVHVANTIEVIRPVDASHRLDLSVRAEQLRPHARGRVVDLVATATVDGETVWRSRSEYLRREKAASGHAPSGLTSEDRASRDGGASADPTPARAERVPRSRAVWPVRPDVARAYAAVSGDRNPIHTSTVAARLFGFPRRIAHGMWSKARSLAALEGRLPDAYTVDVSFKLPVLLPSTVAFTATEETDGWRIALDDARTGRPHLVGSIQLSAAAKA